MTKQKYQPTPFGDIRKEAGVTQEDFAGTLRVSRVQLNKIEKKPASKLNWYERIIVAAFRSIGVRKFIRILNQSKDK